MKILLINKFFYRRGGSEAYFFALKKILERNGHEVVEFSMADEKNLLSKYSEYFVENIDFREPSGGLISDLKKAGRFIFSLSAQKKLAALIKATKPDIAHLHNFSHQLTSSILPVLNKYNIPIVQTLHDYQLICPNYKLFCQGKICEQCRGDNFYEAVINKCVNDSYRDSFISAVEQYLANYLNKKYIDVFISPSRFLLNKVKNWSRENLSLNLVYLSNFIDLSFWQGSEEIGDYIVYCGRLNDEKGVKSLIQAVNNLPEVNLKVIGDGPLKSELENIAGENIEFIGYKNQEEIKNLVGKAKFVVVPSVWPENNPIIVLETMALGKPVVATNLGGLPELIDDGQGGLICRPDDINDLSEKIKKLYFDLDKIKQFGAYNRQKAIAEYSADKHYRQLIGIYESLVKPKNN